MKKKITAVITAAFMLQSIALASFDAKLDKEADKIIVSGETEKNNVTIMLLNPGYSIDNTDEDGILSESVRFYRPVEAIEGKYSYNINMPSDSEKGAYTLYVDSDDKVIYYASSAERLSMIEEINEALAQGTLEGYLSSNGAYLCDSEKFLEVTDISKVSSVAKKKFKTVTLTANSPESLEKINEILDLSVVVQLLNESKIDAVSEVAKVIDEENMAIKYSENLSIIPSAKQKDIVSRISGKNISTEEAFYEALEESIFIGVINDSKTISSAERKKFFDEYALDANLDISDYALLDETTKASVINQLSAAKMTSASDMQAKLDELYEENKPEEKGSGSTRPSGGGGGGGGGSHVSAGGGGGAAISKNEGMSFSDMNTHRWAEEAVKNLNSKGIIKGYENGTFNPGGSVTRAEFISMIQRAFLPQNSSLVNPFNDIAPEDWYFYSVMSAYENNIISGVGEGKFLPNEKIRRLDMAVILNNLLKFKGIELKEGEKAFNDNDAISEYAKQAVNVLSVNGIINGDTNNNFRPSDYANRAEAAVMLQRFIVLTEGEVAK